MISIEEYRSIEETPEEEWNMIYNNKKISIEALEHIEIKKRGKGPEKPIYISHSDKPGPFYDPISSHVHIFKKDSLIKNFTSEQDPRCKFVQYRDYKPGTYCSICHCSCEKFHFNFMGSNKKPRINSHFKNLSIDENPKIITEPSIDENSKIIIEPFTSSKKSYHAEWKRVITRVIHSLNNKKIVYPISKYKSLLLWPWQLTPYQKFKLENKNYKNSCIFVKSKIEFFREDYACIV